MANSQEQDADLLLQICTEIFLLGQQISSGKAELPEFATLQGRVFTLFETMKKRSLKAGIGAPEVEDAAFALASYVDEMVQYSRWPGKQQWSANPLQAIMFGESNAGTVFFHRLENIRRSSQAVAQIYYTALVLGFMGEFRMTGGQETEVLIEDLRRELYGKRVRKLSPNGRRPDDRVEGRRRLPLLPIAGICLFLAVGTVVALYFILVSGRNEALEALQQMGRG